MKKRRIISIVIIFVFLLVFFIIRMQNESINRRYSNMKKDLIEYKSANICIISKTEHEGIVGYSVGASGIIFKKDENGYYALTANHVVNKENTEFLIMTVNDPTLLEYRKNHPDVEIVSNDKYYNQFPTAEVVYENEEADLAILYFESDQDLECMSISLDNPRKGDKIIAIGTYSEKMEYFVETCGKIKQTQTSTFHTNDGAMDNKILRHSAFVAEGFSGGGVVNENMELVGMNIGGQKNIFGGFSCGVMIPCEQINKCIVMSGLTFE